MASVQFLLFVYVFVFLPIREYKRWRRRRKCALNHQYAMGWHDGMASEYPSWDRECPSADYIDGFLSAWQTRQGD